MGRYLDDFLTAGKTKQDLLSAEQQAFRIFYHEAVQHTDCRNYWEWLAFGQHHGLATRLLDWTYSPLVALFFAVWRSTANDSCVYVLDRNIRFVSTKEESETDPFDVAQHCAYLPAHVTPRLRAQSGLFTIHPDPTTPLVDHVVGVVKISKAKRAQIKLCLNHLGIHEKALFPDEDGLSRWLNWMKFDCIRE